MTYIPFSRAPVRLSPRTSVDPLNLQPRQAAEHFGERPMRQLGPASIASEALIRELLTKTATTLGLKYSANFLYSEWESLIDAYQLDSSEAYRDIKWLGRKTRMNELQRFGLWPVFGSALETLKARNLTTRAAMYTKLAQSLAGRARLPYEHVVVDEAQDMGVAQLRFLAALGGARPNGLFFAGDLGQRIFQQPFSWKSLGIDIRGRARTLQINYRTSHQIRKQADLLLGPEVSDADGNVEDRRGTISVFNGPAPLIQTFKTEADEIAAVAAWLRELEHANSAQHEIGVFVRSADQIARAVAAVTQARLPYKILDDLVETTTGYASIATMHLAKGLESRAVAVLACDDEVIPMQARIESAADDSDLEEVYNTERHLLYVACTRARSVVGHGSRTGVRVFGGFGQQRQTE